MPVIESVENVSQVVGSTAPGGSSRTTQPLGHRLRVETVFDDDQWLAQETLTGMFGEGDTQDDAFRDLVRSMIALRLELATHADALTPRLRDQLAELEALFSPHA